MEKTVNLNLPGVIELGREELKKNNGGSILLFLGIVATVISIGAAVDYVAGEIVEGWENPK